MVHEEDYSSWDLVSILRILAAIGSMELVQIADYG